MKFIKLIILLPLLMGASFPLQHEDSPIEWKHFNDGFQQAIDDGKIAIIDCYTDWCGWCKVMDQKTFTDSGIIARIQKDFVAIKFNPEKKEEIYITGGDTLTGGQLLYALSNNNPSGYPTFFFFVPQTKQMFQIPGYQDVAKFNETLDNVLRYQQANETAIDPN
jgi:uncharacterized protein YyaL (SSP411 family)